LVLNQLFPLDAESPESGNLQQAALDGLFSSGVNRKDGKPENHRINLRVKAGTNHRRIADSRKFRFCSPLHIDELRERALYAASLIAGSALKIGRH